MKVHFISGKGGVGKSTLSAAFAWQLYQKGEGPILVCDALGNGYASQLLGEKNLQYKISESLKYPGLFFTKLSPMESFREYFSILLTLGHQDAFISQMTNRWRENLIDLVLDNKAVRSFVHACPGLEPIVILGKIFWEAKNGKDPKNKTPWKHIVVDSPASGHFLMLFRSTLALKNVFDSGIIRGQAEKLDNFIHDSSMTHVYLSSLLEELPLQETLETVALLKQLDIKVSKIWLNRTPLLNEDFPSETNSNLDSKWKKVLDASRSHLEEQKELLEKYQKHFENQLRPIPYLTGDLSQHFAEIAQAL